MQKRGGDARGGEGARAPISRQSTLDAHAHALAGRLHASEHFVIRSIYNILYYTISAHRPGRCTPELMAASVMVGGHESLWIAGGDQAQVVAVLGHRE